ncbi:MAG: hypothetical protein R3B13_28920 [Polyangiaceae bacterium]
MTRLERLFWVLALCAASVGGVVIGCARDEDAPSEPAAQPVDPPLLAFLSRARSAHHIADEHEEAKRLDKAILALRGVVSGPIPSSNPLRPEVREVLADTRARLADLESQQGNFDVAAKDIDAGLELVPERTYFRGHLFEVRGLLEDRRAKALSAEGKSADALAAKQRALSAFETSMEIQAEVINQAVGPAEGP